MPASKEGVHIYRDAWAPEHLALLCGISNAGGGALIVASAASSRIAGLGRLRKPFEKIPEIAQRELGIACSTFPVLDGPLVRLEIAVPAADPEKPVRLDGSYWFYDAESDRNLRLSLSEIRERQAEATAPSAPTTNQPEERATQLDDSASSAQAIMQAFEEMVDKLADVVEGTTIRKNGSTFIVEFPHDEMTAADSSRTATEHTAEESDDQKRVSMHDLNPKAREFSQRSLAAANKMSMTSTDEFVLQVLHANGRATAPRIADLLGVSESTVRRSFKQLKNLGLIERIGSTKAGYWHTLD